MTSDQLTQALIVARSNDDLSNESIEVFDGYGLPGFKPVFCTVRALARLIRWQCTYMNGGLDSVALDELARLGRKRFIVI